MQVHTIILQHIQVALN